MLIRSFVKIVLLCCAFALTSTTVIAADDACSTHEGVSLQVLGSGGPIADDERASSGYLVWVDGQARVLIDAGGGVFTRYGESGAAFEDLSFVGLSHLHTDHSADFISLLKSGVFSSRRGDLTVAGPDAGGPFPGLNQYLNALLSRDGGAYGYLSAYLQGGPTTLKPVMVADETAVYQEDALTIFARPVPHGIVPAVAFRVEASGKAIVFASDQNGSDADFAAFAENADLLIMHLVIGENGGARSRELHATPSQIGAIAKAANPRQLLLSHFMARSLEALGDNLALVEEHSGLTPLVAADLACFPLP